MSEKEFEGLIRSRGLTEAEEHFWRRAQTPPLKHDPEKIPKDRASLEELHESVFKKLQKGRRDHGQGH